MPEINVSITDLVGVVQYKPDIAPHYASSIRAIAVPDAAAYTWKNAKNVIHTLYNRQAA